MPPKRKPLSAALGQAGDGGDHLDEQPEAEITSALAPGAPRKRAVVKTRTIQQTVYLRPVVYEQLRKIAFDERVKMHDLLMEGLSLAFEKRGLPTVEQLARLAFSTTKGPLVPGARKGEGGP
jgi:hypothetical protein